jgi:5-methylcytosine-specific restriction protein A
MPYSPARPCPMAGCGRLACSVHAQGRFSRSRGWNWSTVVVPAVLTRDSHRCVLCGRPCPHPRHHDVDHIVPRSQGGTDDGSNLRTLCRRANRGEDGLCE